MYSVLKLVTTLWFCWGMTMIKSICCNIISSLFTIHRKVSRPFLLQMCGKYPETIWGYLQSLEKAILERYVQFYKVSSVLSFNVHLAVISGLESWSRKYLRLWWNSFGSRKNNERKGSRQREIWSPPRNADHAKNWTSSKCCHFIGSLYW